MPDLSRRHFLLGAAVSGAALTVGPTASHRESALTRALAPMAAAAGIRPPVIHTYSSGATSWDFSTGWYGDYVNQAKINEMVDKGLTELTGQATVAAAWAALLPGYSPGKGIAIKVNFNNSGSCSETDNIIDGLVEPVNALIRGMKLNGVREQDIWIYDAVRDIPERFRTRCAYPGVHFVDRECSESATFDSTDAQATIHFGNSNLNTRRLADVLINATYLINIPIVKEHGIPGVTLGFKNHFGSINYVMGQGADNLHDFIDPTSASYSSAYSPLIDIFSNPHIRNKTVLIVGDGLYGCLGNTNLPPSRWQTFGNAAPNSLFFATDPVAIDSVMMDIIYAEPSDHPMAVTDSDDYLGLAAAAGLGVFEHGTPWSTSYRTIGYKRIDVTSQATTINLAAGWNLIALPFSPTTNYTAESTAAEIKAQGGNCTEIDRWVNGGWNAHVPGLPFNDFGLAPGNGFFCKCTKPSVWSLTGYPFQQAGAIQLSAGWNLISISHSATPLTAQSLIAAITAQGGNCVEVDRWVNGGWNAYIASLPFNNFTIESGKGYFVKCAKSSSYVP